MTNCTPAPLEFPVLNRKKIQAQFSGGDITSDGGSLLLRQIDRKIGFLESVNAVINDPRDPRFIQHSQVSLLRQRIYSIAMGYEDLNDHDALRIDPGLQTAVDREQVLSSASTLCRLENRIDRGTAVKLHEVFIEQFIDSFKNSPKQLILDVDATDDRVHGDQQGKYYHGYYRHNVLTCSTSTIVGYHGS